MKKEKKPEEFDDLYIFAEFASGFNDYRYPYYKFVGKKVFNLQLRYWVEALNKFQSIYDGDERVEELLLILDMLCHSLEALAGVNIKPPPNNKTASLIVLYGKQKKGKAWDLKEEKLDLFKELEEMDWFQKNLSKHINKSDSRKEMLKQINYEKIRKYMNVTREIWLWILNKRYRSKIPEDQLKLFRYEF